MSQCHELHGKDLTAPEHRIHRLAVSHSRVLSCKGTSDAKRDLPLCSRRLCERRARSHSEAATIFAIQTLTRHPPVAPARGQAGRWLQDLSVRFQQFDGIAFCAGCLDDDCTVPHQQCPDVLAPLFSVPPVFSSDVSGSSVIMAQRGSRSKTLTIYFSVPIL